ncbi:DUF2911 domain-containing protein [Robertkochia solimangrovi]|uniref:DUF2911 domain-containing protein n=1 Tax=Robertkochia solimangrovi TaxID=2213046 RepID=UPI00118065EF|nr:DUF2911 domain-containing protein [Robertkochia solimangrovi]TRZ43477.1 dihydrolipoamide dehydrogenase [Robertkochia solimangrovi]
MKSKFIAVCFFLASFIVSAQIQTPQPSPSSKIEQKVGLTDVTINYSRPSMRGRAVFGDLVPYGEVWRTGANSNTIISFSTDVTVGGQEVKAGSYALYTVPGVEDWEIMLYSDTSNWGLPQEWDDKKVVATVMTKPLKMPTKIETFTMSVDDLTNNGALIGILWEDLYVGIPFDVPTDKMVMESIDRVMNGPGSQDYFSAAVYYLQEGKDLKQAGEWIDKAIAMQDEPPYWMLRQKSLIQAANGDKKGAIATAKQSLAAAEKAGNKDYVALNKKSLEEWGGK